MKKHLKIILALGILAVFIISISAVNAANVYVSEKGSDMGKGTKDKPFKTIKKAVYKAKNGDTIYLNSGTYTGASNRKIYVNKNIKITALSKNINKANTKVNAERKGYFFFIGKNKKVTFSGITFNNGKDTMGGAIYSNEGKLTVNKCKFNSNKATKYYGGAVYAYKGSVNIKNSVFTSNSAKKEGGGVYVYKATVSISNSQFNKNSAEKGGAILQNTKTLTITETKFTSNKATKLGGGVYIFSTNAAISNSQFNKNTANYGGAVYAYKVSANIKSSAFTSNSVKEYGGGIYTHSSTGSISNSQFNKNSAGYGEGHAIRGDIDSKLSISNCNLIDNKCIVNYDSSIRSLAENIKKTVNSNLPTNQYVAELSNAVLNWVQLNIEYPEHTVKYNNNGFPIDNDYTSFFQKNGYDQRHIREPELVLRTGYGVCEGTGKLTVALLNYLNIPTLYVTGNGTGSDVYRAHAWPVVYINNQFTPGEPGQYYAENFNINAINWFNDKSFIDDGAAKTCGAVSIDSTTSTFTIKGSYINNNYGYGIVFKSYT